MKKIVVFCLMACISISAVTAQKMLPKVLRHIVLFKFKDSASAESIKKVEVAFNLLPSKIKSIKGFEWGINNSKENLNEGLTHCFIVAFTSEKDRDNYIINPAHKAFVAILSPILDKAVVVDFWVKK